MAPRCCARRRPITQRCSWMSRQRKGPTVRCSRRTPTTRPHLRIAAWLR